MQPMTLPLNFHYMPFSGKMKLKQALNKLLNFAFTRRYVLPSAVVLMKFIKWLRLALGNSITVIRKVLNLILQATMTNSKQNLSLTFVTRENFLWKCNIKSRFFSLDPYLMSIQTKLIGVSVWNVTHSHQFSSKVIQYEFVWLFFLR